MVEIQYGPIATDKPRPPIVRNGRRLTRGVLVALHNSASFGVPDTTLAHALGRSVRGVKRLRRGNSEALVDLPIEAEKRLLQLVAETAVAKGFDGATICAKVHGDCFPREDPADVRNLLGWFKEPLTS